MNKSDKFKWIELGRCFAIFTVILCHIVEIVYSTNLSNTHYLNMDFMSSQGMLSRIFAHLVFTLGRLGVPIFLMTSGYLLFDRKYTKDYTIKFYKRNFLGMFFCSVAWIIIYNIFICLFRNTTISLGSILKQIVFIEWVALDHWWFMNMIILAYLLMPIVSTIVHRMPRKLGIFLFSTYCIYTGIYQITDDIIVSFGYKGLPESLSLGYTYGIFFIYVIMGFLIKKDILKKVSSTILAYISISTFGIIFVFSVLAYTIGAGFNVWYDCPLMLISTVCLFELLSRVENVRYYNIVSKVSYYSFGIYLVHILVREIMFKFLPKFTSFLPVVVILATIINFIITYILVFLINKIPKVGNLLLYIKDNKNSK